MKHYPRYVLMALAASALVFSTGTMAAQASKSPAAAQAPAKPVNKKDASYIVGWDMGSQLPPIVRDELDPSVVAEAVKDALSGKKSKFSKEQTEQIRQAFVAQLQSKAKARYQKMAAKNKRESMAFLAKNKKKPGVKVTSSGLQYEVIKQGTGAHPGPQDTVEIEYVGTLVDGTVFQDSNKANHGKPVSIPLDNVIPGFREGIELMQVGGHYKLFIPPELGYGERPNNKFPPNEALIFDIKLLKTTPPAPGGGADGGGN
jgi:FKBP-type peptidyl-prolyl cis-trans isomerase FkpA/FKBP-type peptidyl-prolyl cis-trans isomerase FklB